MLESNPPGIIFADEAIRSGSRAFSSGFIIASEGYMP
jgi:hypothetical protein